MKKGKLFLILISTIAISLTLMAFTIDHGNLDLAKVCSDQGYSLFLNGSTAYSWSCISPEGYMVGMDLDGACRSQFGSLFEARFRDFNDPYSWMCMPIYSNGF